MPEHQKKQQQILAKLGIEALNAMQIEAHEAISSGDEVVLLSPTGTGKTLAFLLPLLNSLDPQLEEVQLLILVPSRELAIQIEQVSRDMGSGFKVNAVYGGRATYKDKNDLRHPPAILIGTPGRVADHIRSEVLDTNFIKTLVLDEFDKSLETGFEKEMKEIITSIPHIEKRVLTSATHNVQIPNFVGLSTPNYLRFLEEKEEALLRLKVAETSAIDELGTLALILGHIGDGRGIVFCNLKDSIQTVSSFLQRKKIPHICFYGGMDQLDREHALIKFRNGTHRILIATDLAARGIDVPELDFIIHYEIPYDEASFVHRNGRTARMNKDGTAFVIKDQHRRLPDYIRGAIPITLNNTNRPPKSEWETLYILGGRKDKISKGDIAGLFFKQGGLLKDELGVIELKQDCAYVAVPKAKARQLINELNNSRLKKKKIRVSVLK